MQTSSSKKFLSCDFRLANGLTQVGGRKTASITKGQEAISTQLFDRLLEHE